MKINSTILCQKLSLDTENSTRPKIAVFSHERSGTHFIMNTIAENFGYITEPWWMFEYSMAYDIYHNETLLEYFREYKNQPILNILKSHHSSSFFVDALEEILEDYKVIYIFRDPRDVLQSYWNYIHRMEAFVGKKTETISEFIHSAPCGAMLRYQTSQSETVIDRWVDHVQGWIDLSNKVNSENMLLLNYEILNLKFDFALELLEKFLDKKIQSPIRPDKEKNTVLPGPGIVGNYAKYFTKEDLDFIESKAGDLMRTLGYIN